MRTKLCFLCFVLSMAIGVAKVHAQECWVWTDTKIVDNPNGVDVHSSTQQSNKVKRFWTRMMKNRAESEFVTVTWDDPPRKILFGKEDELTIPYYREFSGALNSQSLATYKSLIQVNGSISAMSYNTGNASQAFLVGDGNTLRVQGHFDSKRFVNEKKVTMSVIVNIDYIVSPGHPITVSQIHNYVYNGPGGLVEENIDPPVRPGEYGGSKIPWGFIIGGVAVVAVGGIAIAASKKTKKPAQKTEAKKKEPEKKAEAPSTFQMILYKDFGDTLIVGDEPRLVGARIEEITPTGRKIDRPDLTAKISITAEDNCALSEVGMSGRYMSAGIVALHAPKNGEEGTAKVRFLFNGPYGTLINYVVFKVGGEPEILIGEGLTFEAGGGKTRYIEFRIQNYNGVVKDVQVTIDKRAESLFHSELEVDKDDPYKFRINITECGPKRNAGGEHHISGDADCYICNITVNLESWKDPVLASFDLYRMNLGVSLYVHALKAYLVDYHSSYNSEILATEPERKKKWGESPTTFKLVVEDQSSGQIKSVIPDEEPIFTFEDVEEGSMMFSDKFGNQIASPCGLMNFRFDLQGVSSDNTVRGVIHSCGGGLLPPNRAKAKVSVIVSYQGKLYQDAVTVPIISQPYRDISDDIEYNRQLHEDEEKLDKLIKIRSKIAFDPRFADLIPFYYKVNAMVEGYKPEFGLCESDYQKVMKAYNDYCSGKMGRYFVNDAVWTPAWTAADENLNAFVATYGEMERSWYGIAARIALGYFTAGASELVFTPASGLVKLKEYVDKGGDSAYEGFKTVSSEVILWEGVFYVGGEAVKWAGGKIKNLADQKGITDKMKAGYKKIKDFVVGAEKSKEVSKGLSRPPAHSTKPLGDRVKQVGQQAKQTERTAASKANEAIKKAMEQGDDAARFGSSAFNEECAKWAKQDAQKILDDFKRVMNNPTATPEEIRRATLALQGNKAAQNLLRESPSDLLRANFNANLKKIYQEADQLTMEELAARLGVKKEDIRVWDGASANANSDLYLGKKIGADRDVTFQVRGKDGNWVDIREDIMEQAYADAFTEYHYGFMPKDQQEAVKTLRKFDQAVVNGETGLESFGKDLNNIIVKELQSSKLMDPERVAKTVKYKCDFWLKQGKSCRDQAEQLFNAGLVDEAKHVMGYGEELVKEGVRMNVKEFKRILHPRIEALKVKGTLPKDYGVLYEKIKVLEAIGTPPPQGVTPLSLEKARQVLKSQYGTTIEEVVNECTNVIPELNPYL